MKTQVLAQVGALTVAVNLHYTSREPWQVALTMVANPVGPTWLFARELLVEGLIIPTGLGDVTVTPTPAGRAVEVWLSSPDGEATLVFNRDDIREVLRSTFLVCKRGRESRHLDWDTEMAALVAGEEQT